jgi:hypothetical protein
MPQAGIEQKIPVFRPVMTFHASERAAMVIGVYEALFHFILQVSSTRCGITTGGNYSTLTIIICNFHTLR